MRRTATLLTVAVFALAGCASSDDEADAKPTVAKASASQSSSNPPSPSPSPSREALHVGDTVDIGEPLVISAAVLGYDDKGVTGVPELLGAGQKWSVLEVKVCNTGTEAMSVSPSPWSLAYADGVRVESAGMNAGELPQPLYPMDAKVKGGDCVRGNIAFQVPKQGAPERVLYSPSDLDEPVEWLVGKS